MSEIQVSYRGRKAWHERRCSLLEELDRLGSEVEVHVIQEGAHQDKSGDGQQNVANHSVTSALVNLLVEFHFPAFLQEHEVDVVGRRDLK